MIKKLSFIILTTFLLVNASLPVMAQDAGQPAEEAMMTTDAEAPSDTAETTAPDPTQINGDIYKNEGFTIVPANPNTVNPRQFMFELRPGEQTEDFIEIRNLSDHEESYLLYGADPTFSAQGTPAYKTRQAGGTGEGQWIKFDTPEVTLASHETKLLRFTVTVPQGTVLGDYRAGIAMEKSRHDVQNPGITIATRIILHCAIKVTDNPQPIQKLDGSAPVVTAAPQPADSWREIYFWISLVLFITSLAALIWIMLQERKQAARKYTAVTHPKTVEEKPAAHPKPAAKKPAKTRAKRAAKSAVKKKSTAKTASKTKAKSRAKKK